MMVTGLKIVLIHLALQAVKQQDGFYKRGYQLFNVYCTNGKKVNNINK